MNRGVVLVLAAMLAGCADDTEPRGESRGAQTESQLAPPTANRPGRATEVTDTASPEAAAAVVRAYYDAIAARDYTRAYALWSDSGRASNQTFDAFKSGYSQTRTIEANVGTPGRIEGAAGSRYIEVPVTVRATTTKDERQCFRGAYALRRTEVEGATAEQRQWRIHSADLKKRPTRECVHGPGGAAADSLRILAETFGDQLARVSLLAPEDVRRRDMRRHYGPFVTPALLEQWLADPTGAPGRETSSPWPGRIEVLRIERVTADRYRIVAHVVYIASAEGGPAEVAREPVTIEATRTSVGWRISGWS